MEVEACYSAPPTQPTTPASWAMGAGETTGGLDATAGSNYVVVSPSRKRKLGEEVPSSSTSTTAAALRETTPMLHERTDGLGKRLAGSDVNNLDPPFIVYPRN